MRTNQNLTCWLLLCAVSNCQRSLLIEPDVKHLWNVSDEEIWFLLCLGLGSAVPKSFYLVFGGRSELFQAFDLILFRKEMIYCLHLSHDSFIFLRDFGKGTLQNSEKSGLFCFLDLAYFHVHYSYQAALQVLQVVDSVHKNLIDVSDMVFMNFMEVSCLVLHHPEALWNPFRMSHCL